MLLSTHTFGQNEECQVSMDQILLQKRFSMYQCRINGATFNKQSHHVSFQPNHPALDTIYFSYANHQKEMIITRFTPGERYVITVGCGDVGFEIYEEKKHLSIVQTKENLENQGEEYFPVWESGNVRFKLINSSINDTLIGMYGNFSMPIGKLLTLDAPQSDFLQADKALCGSNNDDIVVASLINHKASNDWYEINGHTIDWSAFSFEDLVVHAKISVRLFNKENVIATYDRKRKQLRMEIEE